MKVPLSWLREYVAFDATAEEVARRLTFSGTEVEGIATVGSDYAGLVVGEVLGVEAHPQADRLKLCRVSDGRRELRVVCGAPNVAAGQKAALAAAGVTLPNGVKIREAKIRGELSQGMLCAEDELKLSDDHTGLLVLPADAPVGAPLAEVLGPAEQVLQVEVTWNRPDCLSIVGLAREVAALFGTRLQLPAVEFPEAGAAVGELASVAVEDPVGCPRYTARVLTGVTLGPSPRWLQRRLALCGVRPINNVVDITNYVMLEIGQPLHAFDHALLHGGRIVVRRARPGETLRTLDDVDRPLTPETLVIADADRPVAVAGVMGGAGSEIRDNTRTVLLESACFDAPCVRRTAARLELRTESSFRYERGVDPERADWGSRRAAALMGQLAGAQAARGVIDVDAGRAAPRVVTCRYAKARNLLGTDLPADEVIRLLESLELGVVEREAAQCKVRVPSFRQDLEIEADLIEEIARLNGLDRVPDVLPQGKIVPEADDSRSRAVAACRHQLVALGLSEIMNYSFLAPQLLDTFDPADAAARVTLPNPVSADHSCMRHHLTAQMVDTLGRNLARQTLQAGLFEIGRVFSRREDGRAIGEEDRVCIGLMGGVGRTGIDGNRPVTPEELFLWGKGVVEALCRAQRAGAVGFQPVAVPWFEPGWGVAVLLDGQPLGRLGLVAQSVGRRWRFAAPVAVAELALEPLCAKVFTAPKLKPVPAFPGIRRDMAVLVEQRVTHEQVLRAIRGAAPSELTGVALFDIFESESMGRTRKSMAYALTYRSLERSLTDEEANRFHETIKQAVRSELKAELRDGQSGS